MTLAARLAVSVACAAIAAFLVVATWLPAESGLRRCEATVVGIASLTNTWHVVELVTADGIRLTCRGRHGWPTFGPGRCPLEAFERVAGRKVSVLHDGRRPYEVISGGETILDRSAHRKARLVAFVLAGLMLVLAVAVWRRAA